MSGQTPLPKGVEAVVNDRKAKLTISAGEFTSGVQRSLTVAKNGIRIERRSEGNRILKIKAMLYRTDVAVSLPINPRTQVELKEELPPGNYQIEVTLYDAEVDPVRRLFMVMRF